MAIAFAVFHTINLPATGRHARDHLDIVLHELVHVYQYERAGSRYFAEALLAQRRKATAMAVRRACTWRTSRPPSARLQPRAAGADRQDYFVHLAEVDRTAYEPFIGELRQGKI